MGRVESPVKKIMDRPNTTYRINKSYDLEGETLEIPKNCTLVFGRRGKIYNGKLVGNNTAIKGKKGALGVTLQGKWNSSIISDEWFDTTLLSDEVILENINTLMRDDIVQDVFLKKDSYNCSVQKEALVLNLASNTNVYLSSTLQLLPTDRKKYSIISIKDKKNVTVEGGTIKGDVKTHIVTDAKSPGEWGMGINIINSENVKVQDVTISHCWGDGVYVGGRSESKVGQYKNASKNVTIKNVICDDNRRQGMSITHVDGLEVLGCSFINTGKTQFTQPGAGVDIEPNIENKQNESCRNIYFSDCVFRDNSGSAFFQFNSVATEHGNSLDNIVITNCQFSGYVGICVPSITFESCEIEDMFVFVNSSPVNAVFKECKLCSKNVQIREKKSRRGFDGTIALVFNECELILHDAADWLEAKNSGKLNEISIKGCSVFLPKDESIIDMDTIKSLVKSGDGNNIYYGI